MDGPNRCKNYRLAGGLFWAFMLAALLAGCQAIPGLPGGSSPAIPQATPPPPFTPTLPLVIVTETATVQTVPPPLPAELPRTVNIYLIAIEDQGKSGAPVGCGDSLVAVPIPLPQSVDPLRTALETLLSNHEQYFGSSGLYNALYQSNLQFESLTTGASGDVTVHLSGAPQLGGECDDPRFKAQLEATVRQFPQFQSAKITLNGQPLDELLSGQSPRETVPPAPTSIPSGGTIIQEGKIYHSL